MIVETGEIVAIEKGFVWVETYQQSTCGKCVAQSGCGQSLLSKFGARATKIRVPLGKQTQQTFVHGQKVQIGIEESAFILGVFYLYWVPLIFMLIGLWCADAMRLGEGVSALIVFSALFIGVFFSRLFVYVRNKSEPLQPKLLTIK